jgi:AraC-like DNA-binding protein
LIYLYTQSILYKDFLMTGRKWIHFVPFLILFLATECVYLFQPRTVKLSILRDVLSRNIPTYAFFGPVIVFFQFYLYVAASQRLIKEYTKIAHDQYADQQHANISWLSSTIKFFVFCMLVTTLNGLIGLTPLSKYFYPVFTLVILGLFIFINRVLLKALQKPELFALMNDPGPLRVNPTSKYAGSLLSEKERTAILERLQHYMNAEKPYLQAELTLDQLAEQIGIRPKILSQVINDLLKQNFFDLINRYRIEEAKKLLTNPVDKKLTILEVLYEVGFNSKSSFNTLFKKYIGLTPSEFKQKNSNS